MATRLAGIQPGYLPWLGFFDQMQRVDVFLIADELPYSTSGWAHRNRVLGPAGVHWLTLPTRHTAGEAIVDVKLDPAALWRKKHLRTLRHFYADGVGVRETLDDLASHIPSQPRSLTEVTVPTIRFLAERLGIETPIVVSSELGLEAHYRARFPDGPCRGHRIVAYMDALGADELLEGETGEAYTDIALFAGFGKRVRFHRYDHPSYRQCHGDGFVSHLSVIDLLLGVGPDEARRVLQRGRLREDG